MSGSDYKKTLELLFDTLASIHNLCTGLTESQFKTPTQCPGWTVQDNLSHMIGTEKSMGGQGSTMHRATSLEFVKNPIGEMNEHEVDARRSLTGTEVLKEFDQVMSNRRAQLESEPEEYFTKETMTPTGKGTVADFLHIRVMDCWVHEQDIRRALNIAGNQNSASAELTVDRLCRTLPIVVGKRAATPEGSSVVIHITEPVVRKISITVVNGRATVVEAPSSEPLMELFFDSNTFVELATGRATAQEARARWKVSGDTDLGERVVGAINMMI
jgi:uncharacterized protein (TIGR03083 family)